MKFRNLGNSDSENSGILDVPNSIFRFFNLFRIFRIPKFKIHSGTSLICTSYVHLHPASASAYVSRVASCVVQHARMPWPWSSVIMSISKNIDCRASCNQIGTYDIYRYRYIIYIDWTALARARNTRTIDATLTIRIIIIHYMGLCERILYFVYVICCMS
jgi:hypothetical protein